MLPYWKYRHTPGAALPIDDPPPVPTSVSLFGGERVPFPRLPRDLADRYFTVSRWEEHDDGGHFPAAATPELFAETLRDVFRDLRDRRA
jgi:epoxide hydrolase